MNACTSFALMDLLSIFMVPVSSSMRFVYKSTLGMVCLNMSMNFETGILAWLACFMIESNVDWTFATPTPISLTNFPINPATSSTSMPRPFP